MPTAANGRGMNPTQMPANRRPARLGTYKKTDLAALASSASYGGSAHHKAKPADYRFKPAVNPRSTKSLCDDKRVVPFNEAQQLLRHAFQLGMVSSDASPKENALPKYAWAADGNGEVYEAKLGDNGRRYHGYRLSHDDKFRKWALKEWNKRAQKNS